MFRARSTVAAVFFVLAALAVVPAQDQTPPAEPTYSPLGFYDLRAYEQSYPEAPGHPAVLRASLSKYWAYRGVAYRGFTASGGVWESLGPESSLDDPGIAALTNFSGRVAALAISPACTLDGPCRLWVGAAGGGVWRTDNAMHPDDPGWRWVGRGLGTNNIGSLAVDPNDRTGNTILVGTGETNSPHNSGAGTGLYRSTDGGDHWTRVETTILDPAVSAAPIDFTSTRGIAAVVVEPGNSQVIYVATATAMLGMTAVRGGQSQITGFPQPRLGLYRTRDGGATWALIWVPPLAPLIPANPHASVGLGDTMIGVRDVKLDPRNPTIVYATAWNNAIHRSAPSLESGDVVFKPIYALSGFQRFRDLAMFDIAIRDNRARLYVYNGTVDLNEQALWRLDNADVPAASLVTSGPGGGLVNTTAWQRLTTNDTSSPASASRRICGEQCFYDLVVATPPAQPDTVIVGGVATPTFSEPTIRSTTAGVTFSGFGRDGQNPRNSSHVDVRAVVFHPRNPHIAFVGSDGGVVRNDGSFVDITSRCSAQFGTNPVCPTMLRAVPSRLFFLNRGLQTLQFYNIALDPQDPLGRMLGGLQDNSTIWIDGSSPARVWRSLFPFGDGTSASGFHPTRSEVLFASFQSNRFFTNFRNGALNDWVITDDPIRNSNERATITASTGRQFITFDHARPDTQFTAFQHVWRTTNNGGPPAFLEANCRFVTGRTSATCGDWVPLGIAYPFPAGSTPASSSRAPGDLTSDFYGTDRVGGIVVAAERTRADTGTLWAATNFGRLFVSKNADAPAPDVQFRRIDVPTMPNRFVTRIVVDRVDANVAYISYSGFSALTPGAPGHVFRVVFDPASETASFTSLDFDLGDLPINTIAYDDLSGDLYAGTDFGPIVLRSGTQSWQAAGVAFPEVLMVDLEIVPEQRLLVAATHGLGIFYLRLPSVTGAGAVSGHQGRQGHEDMKTSREGSFPRPRTRR
jgi:hypothetical protein